MVRTVEVFPVRKGRVLLLERTEKTGLGKGKIVGPGGKIEPGELPEEAARRELLEETGIRTKKGSLEFVGRATFFSEKKVIESDIFRAKKFSGRKKATREGAPKWFAKEKIPYARMWPDAFFWTLKAIEGKSLCVTAKYSENFKSLKKSDISVNEIRQATLVFPVRKGKVLLISKKRGIGKGLYNGAGGKLDSGESPPAGASRELMEEIGIRTDPHKLNEVAVLDFFFGKRPFMRVFAFLAREFSGNAHETDEALPRYFKIREIPFSKMWPDDRFWLPKALSGKRVYGRFFFDGKGKRLIGKKVIYLS